MSKLVWIITAAAIGISAPAVADAQGKGHGGGKAGHGAMSKGQGSAMSKGQGKMRRDGQVRSDVRARTDARANGRAGMRTGASVDRQRDRNGNGVPDYRERTLADLNRNGVPDYRERRIVDLNGNGIADYRERFIDRDRDGIDDRAGSRYGSNACPPGLAKKSPACLPPGQAKRMFSQGQRLPAGYNSFTDFDDIPLEYRDDIPDRYETDAYRYIYRDDNLYVVDRRTRIVREVLNLLR